MRMEISLVLVRGASSHLADPEVQESMKHLLLQVFDSNLTILDAPYRALRVTIYRA